MRPPWSSARGIVGLIAIVFSSFPGWAQTTLISMIGITASSQEPGVILGMASGVWMGLIGIFFSLTVGTVIRLFLLRGASHDHAKHLKVSLRTWWLLAIVLALAVACGRVGVLGLMAVLSWLGLREYFALTQPGTADRRARWLTYLTIPLTYLWIYLQWYDAFLVFIPIYAVVILASRFVLMEQIDRFTSSMGTILLGIILTVYGLSHAAAVTLLPLDAHATAHTIGWFLLLVILTQVNDIAQALWGRAMGRRKVLPRVSPGKTWEGVIGGVLTTTILAAILMPRLAPGALPNIADQAWYWPSGWGGLGGLIVGVSGFLGDVTLSAVKRDAGVKDSGTMLPGHGGVLDRVDSLTLSGPLFFHYIRLLCS